MELPFLHISILSSISESMNFSFLAETVAVGELLTTCSGLLLAGWLTDISEVGEKLVLLIATN